MTRYLSPDGRIDLRSGRWQEALADVGEVDAVITDPPYSARTDAGYMSHGLHEVAAKTDIGYRPVVEADAIEMAQSFAPRVRCWAVIFGDHISREWHARAWAAVGWYVFAPVIWVKRGAAPRFRADGPASQVDHIMIARPRRAEFMGWGSLPGWYMADTPRAGHGWSGVTGGKDVSAMRAIVRDYSKPGDLICDPCAGGATTLIAAAMEGRRAVGSEMDPKTFELARKRLEKGYTVDMFSG
jgi:hypothetical protein